MPTIRSRAIELASDPANFEVGNPVPFFEKPGEAKLEADAHLAVCANIITGRFKDSEDLKDDFLQSLRNGFYMASRAAGWPEDQPIPNTRIYDLDDPFGGFETVFENVYIKDNSVIQEVLSPSTPFGNKTARACMRYVKTCDRYLKANNIDPSDPNTSVGPADYFMYKDPERLIRAGLLLLSSTAVMALKAINHSHVPVAERPGYLDGSQDGFHKLASLALFQAQGVKQVTVADDKVDVAANIKKLRRVPKYQSPILSLMRPHTGCVAMPNMPEMGPMHAGSAIGDGWALISELIARSKTYAFDDDAEECRILPFPRPKAGNLEEAA